MGFEYGHGEYVVDIDSSPLERVKAAGFGGASQMTPLRRINLPNAEQELSTPYISPISSLYLPTSPYVSLHLSYLGRS